MHVRHPLALPRLSAVLVILALASFIAAGAACGGSDGDDFVPHPDPETIPLFDESGVLDFHVTFPAGQWEKLLALRGEPATRWVKCGFRFATTTFPDATCRRKGNMFDWDRTAAKPQLIVRFNQTDPAGRFMGMRRLNLEYYSDWASPVRDRLGMWLMREAGVPASRVNHVRVFKDGALLGLYQNIEPVDHEWLEDHFGGLNADGNLWESGEQLQTNESHADPQKLMAFQALVEAEPLTGDHRLFWSRLSKVLDVRQVLREMAAETALITHDNFSNNLLNYYLYEHPKRGLSVLPWDFDDIFIPSFVDADPYSFWEHGEPGKLRLLINQNPDWKAEYVANLIDIRDRILTKLPAYLDRVCAQIRPTIAEETTTQYTVDEFDEGCNELRTLIPLRIAALKRLLGR